MEEIRVILVDDTARERDALARYLQLVAGFGVQAYAGGEQALEHLEATEHDFTAVLLDYVLEPDKMSGSDVLQEIRARYPYLPVIVFTGIDPERGVRALSGGAYRYLRKPLDPAELVSIVRGLDEQEAIFRRMAQDVRQMLKSDMCLAWRLDGRTRRFQIVAWDGDNDLDTEYRRTTFLNLDAQATQELFETKKPVFLSNVLDAKTAPHYEPRDYAKEQGWTSLISIPLVRQERIIGLLDSYTYEKLGREEVKAQLDNVLPTFARQTAEVAWNAELSNRLQTIQGLNEVLASTLEENTILQQILAKGIELAGAQAGWIYKLDVNRGKLILKECLGVEEDQVGAERELEAGISGYVAQKGQAQNVHDVTEPGDEYSHLKIASLQVRSEVAVPLRRGEQTIGVLTVTSPLPNTFSAEDVSLLSSLAAQAAVAIGRADVTRHSQRLGELALGAGLQQLADYVVEAARDLTGADATLWFVSDAGEIELTEEEKEKGPWLRIKACKGNFCKDYPETAKTPAGPCSSVIALALERREPVVRRDIQDELEAPEEPRFYNRQAAIDHNWHGFMAVPLVARGGEPLGSLSLYGREVAKFGEAEVDLMKAFAEQVLIVMQNAEWHDMILNLVTIGQDIGQLAAQEPRQSLNQIAYSAWESLEADCVVIYPYARHEKDVFDTANVGSFGLWYPLELAAKQRSAGVTARVVQQGILIVDDVSSCKDLQLDHRLLLRERIKAFAGVSLEREGVSYGVMYVNFREPRHIPDSRHDEIRAWATQAADAVREQYQEEQETQLPAFLQKFAESARKLLDADSIVLYQYHEGRDLEFITPPAIAGTLRDPEPMGRKVYENDAPTRLMRRGTPFYADDVTTDEFTARLDPKVESRDGQPGRPRFLQREGIRSSAGVFLKAANETVGLMFVNYCTPRAFTAELRQRIDLLAGQAAVAIRNARTVEQARALQEITERLAEFTLGQEVVLELVLERALELVGFSKGWISLLDGDTLVMKAARGLYPEEWQDLKVGQGVTGRAAETGEILNISDVRVLEASSYVKFFKKTVSELCVPLKYRESILGIINVESAREEAFNRRDEELLITLASQAAIAIRNAKILEERDKESQSLKILHRIGEEINEERDVQSILDLIVPEAINLLGMDSGIIYLVDTDTMQITADYGYPEGFDHQEPRISKETGLTRTVLTSGVPIVIDDAARDDRINKLLFNQGVRSMAAWPIQRGEKRIGVLFLNGKTVREFAKWERALLDALSEQVAIAIDNAQVLEEREKERDSLKALHEIGKKINEEHQVRPILRLIVREALKLVEMNSGVIHLADTTTKQITASYGYPEEIDHLKPRISEGEGLLFTVLRDGDPIVIPDAEQDARVRPELIEREGIKSMVAWPIQRSKSRIGALFLNGYKVREFAKWERALLDALSEQATIALENAKRYEQLVDSRKAVSEVGRQFTEGIRRLGEEEIVNLLYEQASEVMDTKNMYIALYDEATDEVRFALAFLGGEKVDTATTRGWGPRRGGKGRTEWIIRDRQPLLDRTKAESEAWYKEPGRDEYIGQPFASWVGVPMMIGDRVLGVIATYHATLEYIYDEDDVQVLGMMANYAAVTLYNAGLVQDLDHRIAELDKLRELSEELSAGVWLGET